MNILAFCARSVRLNSRIRIACLVSDCFVVRILALNGMIYISRRGSRYQVRRICVRRLTSRLRHDDASRRHR